MQSDNEESTCSEATQAQTPGLEDFLQAHGNPLLVFCLENLTRTQEPGGLLTHGGPTLHASGAPIEFHCKIKLERGKKINNSVLQRDLRTFIR